MTGGNGHGRSRSLLLVVIGALAAIGPLSLDLYLPGLPAIGTTFSARGSVVQLTLSTCLLGLAVGQILAGPLSDRFGRRIPLLVGVGSFTIASIACAFAPTIETLLLLRLLQGLGGSVGMVIGRAVVRDLYEERESAFVFSRLMLIFGLAPIVAPVFGGVLLLFVDWRGLFIVLAGIGGVLLLCTWIVIPDSLAPENRISAGLMVQLRSISRLVRNRTLMGYAISGGLAGAVLFTYISMSSLVFQGYYGLTAQQYSILFALNSVGIVVASQVNGLLVRRILPRALLSAGLIMAVVASAIAFGTALLLLPLISLVLPLFLAIASNGLQMPNFAALALGPFSRGVGTASALLGAFQLLIGAILPPVVSIFGSSAQLMTGTMLVSGVAAVLVLQVTQRPALDA